MSGEGTALLQLTSRYNKSYHFLLVTFSSLSTFPFSTSVHSQQNSPSSSISFQRSLTLLQETLWSPATFSFLLPPFPILTLLPPQVPSTIYSLSTSCHRLGAQGLRRHLPQYDPGVPYEHHHQAISRITPNCQVVVTSCQSWLCPYETGFSGPATLSMTLPSGWNRF